MGLPFDNRVVEYAYRLNDLREFNLPDVDLEGVVTFRHKIVITYDLLDAEKVFLGNKTISHSTGVFSQKETIPQAEAHLAAWIDAWVIADKQNLSGYTGQ